MAGHDAYLGLSRFGLGSRADGAPPDLHAAMLAEIADRDGALLAGDALLDTSAAMAAYEVQRAARRATRAQPDAAMTDAADAAMMAMDEPGDAMAETGKRKPGAGKKAKGEARAGAQGYGLRQELPLRLARIAEAEVGFLERLVMFWTNHFSIEAKKSGQLRALAGPFEREAIRPHVLGRFEDLLVAVTKHPAMLLYLNNATSIGPDSSLGEKNGKGLNENHARELMELHTLGVDGGYAQADVTNLARMLTGWSVSPARGAEPGQFLFRARAHEPGAQVLLGESYGQKGIRQGEAALQMLAAAPATATHIATKLARHFVADTPPPELIGLLAQRFTDTGGDLKAVSEALIGADASWAAPTAKVRSPQEFVFAAIRALGLTPKPGEVLVALETLGQPLMSPGSPAGFADDAAVWLAPDAMTNRLDFAQLLAEQAGDIDPRELARQVLGARLDPLTAEAISRAESPTQGLALLLMSPEFQRR